MWDVLNWNVKKLAKTENFKMAPTVYILDDINGILWIYKNQLSNI